MVDIRPILVVADDETKPTFHFEVKYSGVEVKSIELLVFDLDGSKINYTDYGYLKPYDSVIEYHIEFTALFLALKPTDIIQLEVVDSNGLKHHSLKYPVSTFDAIR
jgi:hypothetical protein